MQASKLPRALLDRLAAERERRVAQRQFRADELCRRGERIARQQLAFISDLSRWKVACCSRRAGKTVACAILLLQSALANAGSLNLYITLSRVSGKRIVWKWLLRFNREYRLGGVVNRSELSVTFPNGASVLVAGAKDEQEIEKLRGLAPHLVVIDEAQSFKDYVQELVDDIIVPALIETKGTLVLIGTPGKVKSGYFYSACQAAPEALRAAMNVDPPANDNAEADDEEGGGPSVQEWSVHRWTIEDNPFLDDVEDELAKVRRRKRWTADHPTYQREYLGRWVTEHDALVYKYDQARNGYVALPDISGLDWRCIIVVDQGYHDADAIGRLWFRMGQPGVWLEEVHHERKQSSGQLAAAARAVWEPVKGRCIRFLWDEGGGGKKTAEDARFLGCPVEPVEKGQGSVVAGIEVVNTALIAGCLRIPVNGQAAADAPRVTWDPKARGVRLSERYHTDMWDVPKYGLRALQGIIPLDRPAELPTTPKAEEAAELERTDRIRSKLRAASAGTWVDRALKRRRVG